MKKFLSLAAVLCFVLKVSAQLQGDGEVRGGMTDSTGRGLAGVQIDVLSRIGATTGRSTMSDRDGRYALTNLRPGKYNVQYTKKGYATIIVNSILVTADNSTEIEVTLHPATGKEITVVEYIKPLLSFQGVKIH